MRSTHSQKLENFLGGRVHNLSANNRGWYGPPIPLIDVPGQVFVTGDGDFIGDIEAGSQATFFDFLATLKRKYQRALRVATRNRAQLNVGFATLEDLIANADWQSGKIQNCPIYQTFANTASSRRGAVDGWTQGSSLNLPPFVAFNGSTSPAPGGRVIDKSIGGLGYEDPQSGYNLFILTAMAAISLAQDQGAMLYDRLFEVSQTNNTSNQSVTGVPTRYQNTSDHGAYDAVNGNFIYPVITTAISSGSAHAYDNMQYTDQDGNAKTLPSVDGASTSTVAAGYIDIYGAVGNSFNWFCPLDTGDFGVKAITNMKKDTNLGGSGVNGWVIGHPLGWFAFPNTRHLVHQMPLNGPFCLSRILPDASINLLAPNVGGDVAGHVTLISD